MPASYVAASVHSTWLLRIEAESSSVSASMAATTTAQHTSIVGCSTMCYMISVGRFDGYVYAAKTVLSGYRRQSGIPERMRQSDPAGGLATVFRVASSSASV